jgi:hypothetical protein
MSIAPENERTRRAVRWISDRLLEQPSSSRMALVHQAISRFDLTPKEGEELVAFYRAAERGPKTSDV